MLTFASYETLSPPPPTPASLKIVEPGTEVKSVSLQCWRLVERLEPGHAVRVRVDGKLLHGVYSTGGAQQKRQELLLADEETDGAAGGGSARGSGASSGAASDGSGVPTPKTKTVELVPWEPARRLLLACPFATELPVLRYSPPFRLFCVLWLLRLFARVFSFSLAPCS